MIITCQECDTKFVLDGKLIKPTGSKVRCSSCKNVFTVFPETEIPSSVASQPLVSELDSAPLPPSAPSSSPVDAVDDLAEALDRELDILFGPDDGDASDAPPDPAPLSDVPSLESIEDIDLDDLGLDDLGLTGPVTEPVSDSLDLSGLDLDLFSDEGPHSPTGDEMVDILVAPGGSSEESFDFSDPEPVLNGVDGPISPDVPDLAPEASPYGVEEELDFSDFALSFSDEANELESAGETDALSLSLGEASRGGTVSSDGGDELDLSLDDDFFERASQGPSSPPPLPEETGGMDLELDLDLEPEDSIPENFESPLVEELDLSELEYLLQEEPVSTGHVSDADEIELALDADYHEESPAEEMEPLSMESLDALDFSDIEAMLEHDDKPLDATDGLYGMMDLDLDLDLSTDTETVPVDGGQDRAVPLGEVPDDVPPGDEIPPPSKALKTFTQTGRTGSGRRIFFTLVLVVVLLFIILAGVYALRDEIRERTGVAVPTIGVVETLRETVGSLGIPAVSDWVRPEVKDLDGYLNLATQDVAGRFLTSPLLGDLFVITGKVRNNYSTTRHSIRLIGRLFNKENDEVQVKSFFAGNTMGDEELATLSMRQVDDRLSAPLGDGNINARVRPGQLVSFMVVYANLPDDLTEFAVEVKASTEGAATP